ncbi:MAG TPA: hypothetical protein VG675_22545 [Bryobacteraceae bacterium]|nr:hypothetical protein [Bryobacteraceae bacterium]
MDIAQSRSGYDGYDRVLPMKTWLRRSMRILSFAALCTLALSQEPDIPPAAPGATTDVHLPNGKLQRDEILKAEHEQNLKDAGRLVELSKQLQEDLEKNDRYVLSIATLKKTDDIEKLVKKIRSRLRH